MAFKTEIDELYPNLKEDTLARIRHHERVMREAKERRERRRARLQKLSFGLLGRQAASG
jgi:hypothetical protein